jgi:hypothetical protein
MMIDPMPRIVTKGLYQVHIHFILPTNNFAIHDDALKSTRFEIVHIWNEVQILWVDIIDLKPPFYLIREAIIACDYFYA